MKSLEEIANRPLIKLGIASVIWSLALSGNVAAQSPVSAILPNPIAFHLEEPLAVKQYPSSQDSKKKDKEKKKKRKGPRNEWPEDNPPQNQEVQKHSIFVTKMLYEGGAGYDDGYRTYIPAIGGHMAFLKLGKFYVGAPGFLVASLPYYARSKIPNPNGKVTYQMKRRTGILLTESVSYLIAETKSFGKAYLTFAAALDPTGPNNSWKPMGLVSFSKR